MTGIRQPATLASPAPLRRIAAWRGATLHWGDALDCYERWPAPVVVVSDGAYGISGFPGDPPSVDGLVDWYLPHVRAWSKAATGETTLWFWNTEIGWATVHPLLREFGWEYEPISKLPEKDCDAGQLNETQEVWLFQIPSGYAT